MEPRNYEVKTADPKTEVSKFVTRVWEHPLVTKELRTHREKGTELFNGFLEENDFTKDNFVGVPVGSTIWVVDPESSDHDFLVLSNSDDLEQVKFNEMIISMRRELEERKLGLHFDAENINNGVKLEPFVPDPIYMLMITPDEYLAGNIDLAKQIRKLIITHPDFEKIYESMVGNFDFYVRNWTNADTAGELTETKRADRVEEHLSMRGDRSHMSTEKYKEAFEKALGNLRLPPMEIWKTAINESDGALEISEKYASDGVEPNGGT